MNDATEMGALRERARLLESLIVQLRDAHGLRWKSPERNAAYREAWTAIDEAIPVREIFLSKGED